jgi:hypothetical protein
VDKSAAVNKSAAVGDRAGHINSDGYWIISLDGKLYGAHRLAWMYVLGYLPKALDHKNRIRADNIVNLREATRSQNGANSRSKGGAGTGLRGVQRNGHRWVAAITKNNKYIYLGTFESALAAHVAYCTAAKKLHGEFFYDGRN